MIGNNSKFIDLSLDLTEISKNYKQLMNNPKKLGHFGTHIDVMDSPGLPLSRFVTNAHLVDVSHIFDRAIEIDDFKLQEAEFGKGNSILFRTNWLSQYPYGTQEYFLDHPFFATELVDYLLEKKVSIIGIDAPGIKRYDEHKKIDQHCLDQGVFILENLNNLEQIPLGKKFTLYCFPLNMSQTTGITCRCIVEVKNS